MTTPEIDDTRTDPPFMAGDRESLASWLDLYRTTVEIKIGGLSPEHMCTASVPPSRLTLIGIVRHLTEVEQYWLTEVLQGIEMPGIYCSEDHPDGDFERYSAETVTEDLVRYDEVVAQARAHASAVTDLDAPVAGKRRGSDLNLRWILVHLIEEYARHLGHMDLLREAIDGRTGY